MTALLRAEPLKSPPSRSFTCPRTGRARGHGNDPAATYAVAPAPGSPAAHAAHHGDAHHGSAEGP